MKIYKNFVFLSFLIFLLSPFLAHALEQETTDKPEFVFAILATYRTRENLVDKALEQNILAYNINFNSEIDFEKGVMRKVFQRDKNKRWIRASEAPLPDVVYDFGVYKNNPKNKEKAKLLKAQLHDLGIPFINPETDTMEPVNNKRLFAKIMAKNNIPHPKTHTFSKRNLKNMYKKYDQLYIKPTFGSKGYGIITIEKSPNLSTFSIGYKIKNKKEKKWVTIREENINKKKLYAKVSEARKKIKQTNARYIIQQGILTYKYQDKLTDFRFNVQRGELGVQKVSGYQMRIGGNLAQGGRPGNSQIVLQPLELDKDIDHGDLIQKCNHIAILTATALEKKLKQKIGDIGIDIVLDTAGNPYVVEANGKNGFMSTYIEKNPQVDTLFGLPPALEECKQLDGAHEDALLEYARFLSQSSKDFASSNS
ncbi:MAG: YheC/YheD family protein [Myxococcales bacterium]|nr:YheC/YheD family protein [Myxococcales bacterium]USN50124.1 MAG: YheC/YheD family protein [Myxococcales bacterium]